MKYFDIGGFMLPEQFVILNYGYSLVCRTHKPQNDLDNYIACILDKNNDLWYLAKYLIINGYFKVMPWDKYQKLKAFL